MHHLKVAVMPSCGPSVDAITSALASRLDTNRFLEEQGLSSHVFMTERDGPMTPKAFHALFGRIGARAKMQFPIHPHMLRHGCGYALTFSTRSATPSWLLIGLSTSGAENLSSRCRLEPAPCGRNRNACDHVRASSMIACLVRFAP